MTDRQLSSEMDRLSKVMVETSTAHVQYLQGRGGSKAESDRYRKAQKRYSELSSESMRRLQEKAKSSNGRAATASHTFVNGFGEATHRTITNQTYKRRQKSLERAVRRNMGY